MNRKWLRACVLFVVTLWLAQLGASALQAAAPTISHAGSGREHSLARRVASAPLYSLLPGFPVLTTDGQITMCSPTVADLNNDGNMELLVGTYNGKVYAWNAAGGPLAGYPLVTGGRIMGHLALGDLNSDGDLEIVAGASSVDFGVQGYVYIWQPDRTLLPGWPKSVERYGNAEPSEIRTVVLSDIDNDSDLEIVAGTSNNINGTPAEGTGLKVPNLYVWHHTGSLAAGNWPAKDSPAIKGTLAVGDLNGDGQKDILVGRDYHWIFAYDNQGNHLPGWPRETLVPVSGDHNSDPRIIHKLSTPTLADLDRDGEFEYVVAGIRKLPGSSDTVNNDLLVLRPDGSRRPGWTTPAGGSGAVDPETKMQPATALADLNGDNQLDIVVPTQDGWIRAYTPNKTLLWQFNYAGGKVLYASEPVIGDIDDDGLNEVIFGTYDPGRGTLGPVGVWILENDGAVKPGAPLPVEAPGIQAPPALADLNQDGNVDIIAATIGRRVYAWNTGAPYDPNRLPWPVARQNLQRTAYIDPSTYQPDVSGSVKLASDGGPQQGDTLTYTLRLVRTGLPLTYTVQLTDVIPAGLDYVPGSLSATAGAIDDSQPPTLHWSGLLSDTALIEITYGVSVTEPSIALIVNSVDIDAGPAGQITRSATVIANAFKAYLPLTYKKR
jgi:uncharacterized repeat protein (TIGR01451 family)